MKPVLVAVLASSALALAFPAAASSGDGAPPAAAADVQAFARFVPEPGTLATRIDYSIWDDALKFFVFRMGRSLREGAPSVDPGMGTRRIYGHDSRYRLEGNRVMFSFLEPNVISSLTEYRQDLERLADQVDLTRLSRNEQLAYWINLHNVAVIEQIALAYPIQQPSQIRVGGSTLPFDETSFITVNGVRMSPKDIRTRIVYPNWHDPRVIYGFFRGEIGGPSIQAEAYTASNLAELLDQSGREFVNSLRGTEKRGDTLYVSKIYGEAMPFFFPGGKAQLDAHLKKYANDEVRGLIDATDRVEPSIYEGAIADLANGERDPGYGFVQQSNADGDFEAKRSRIPANIARLVSERNQKLEKMMRSGERVGTVVVLPVELPGDAGKPVEVE